MEKILIKIFGIMSTVLSGDPATYDRYEFLKRKLLPGPYRTLDAGCGSGAFSFFAAKIGNEVIAISYDESNNKKAHRRAIILGFDKIQFITGDLRYIDKLKNSLGKFDQIICFETIEHVLNDQKLIKDLADILNPDDGLLLTTPYKYHKPYSRNEKLSTVENGGHVRWGYTFTEIEFMFNKFDLEVIEKEYLSGFFTQKIIYFENLINVTNSKIGWAITFPLRILQLLDYSFTKLIKYPFMCIGVFGKKTENKF